MAVLTERKTLDDLIRHLYAQEGYCQEQALVYNRSDAALTLQDPVGYPLKADESVEAAYQFAASTEEASVTALLISKEPWLAVADNYNRRCKVLVRGPAIIDKVTIPTVDYAAAAFTLATIVTALKGKSPPILCNPEPSVTVTQTS